MPSTPIESHEKPLSSKKEKSPAFQFYPKDFLTDSKVICMTSEQRGYYITLLCIDWLEDGFYPEDILKLAGYDWHHADGTLRDDSEEVRRVLEGCFVLHRSNPAKVTNPRLQKERERQSEWREKCARGGRKSGKVRKASVISIASQTKGTSDLVGSKRELNPNSSSSSSSSSSNINTNNPLPPSLNSDPIQAVIAQLPLDRIGLGTPRVRKALALWGRHCVENLGRPFDAISAEALVAQYSQRPEAFGDDLLFSISKRYKGVFPAKKDDKPNQPGNLGSTVNGILTKMRN